MNEFEVKKIFVDDFVQYEENENIEYECLSCTRVQIDTKKFLYSQKIIT